MGLGKMTSNNNDPSTPLSLRPFPVNDQKPKNLADFITRVNAQPGGFRALSEEKLRQEAEQQQQQNGSAAAPPDDEMSEDDDDDDENDNNNENYDPPSQDPIQARIEVIKNLDTAGNIALLTLDSLSLLLSKQNPTQAGLTLSPQLREMVGIGTLGADRLQEGANTTTEAKDKEQEEVAQGWTIMEINKTRDEAERAAGFLEREIEAESQYWEEVMGVQRSGWLVCKMPQERHTLGVRFGFSEAAPEFARNGLAPMRRADDGSVQLDCGSLGRVSERILVTYLKDDKIISQSSLPAQTDETAPLEARVLEARNTLFSQELWYELTREARSLAGYNVRLQDDTIIYDIDDSSRLTFQLIPLTKSTTSTSNSDESSSSEESGGGNMVEVICLSLHLLLSYAHGNNERIRIHPIPPHISRPRGQQQLWPLIRPIIGRVIHNKNLTTCITYISSLTNALRAAGLSSTGFTLSAPKIAAAAGQETGGSGQQQHAGPNQRSGAHLLIRNMLQPMAFSVKVILVSNNYNNSKEEEEQEEDAGTITLQARTFLHPFTGSYYRIIVPPSIESICPPFKDGYPDMSAVAKYLCILTPRLLASHFQKKNTSGWSVGMDGCSLRHVDGADRAICFSVENEDGGMPVVQVCSVGGGGGGRIGRWRWSLGRENGGGKGIVEVVNYLMA